MRLLAVMLVTLCGCGHGQLGTGIAVAALESIGFIAEAIAHAPPRPEPTEPTGIEEPPPPSGIRNYWRGPERECRRGRTIHLVCVTARSGSSCFWETSEGKPFDCPDEKCELVPGELAEWCF